METCYRCNHHAFGTDVIIISRQAMAFLNRIHNGDIATEDHCIDDMENVKKYYNPTLHDKHCCSS